MWVDPRLLKAVCSIEVSAKFMQEKKYLYFRHVLFLQFTFINDQSNVLFSSIYINYVHINSASSPPLSSVYLLDIRVRWKIRIGKHVWFVPNTDAESGGKHNPSPRKVCNIFPYLMLVTVFPPLNPFMTETVTI